MRRPVSGRDAVRSQVIGVPTGTLTVGVIDADGTNRLLVELIFGVRNSQHITSRACFTDTVLLPSIDVETANARRQSQARRRYSRYIALAINRHMTTTYFKRPLCWDQQCSSLRFNQLLDGEDRRSGDTTGVGANCCCPRRDAIR